ncbi:hypothetical protein HK102_003844 [Quaeritorhiza haematococci]|nr:hypothetical protein HK102_003844 [Quaeritorhiza haematococci]
MGISPGQLTVLSNNKGQVLHGDVARQAQEDLDPNSIPVGVPLNRTLTGTSFVGIALPRTLTNQSARSTSSARSAKSAKVKRFFSAILFGRQGI